jgi:hypothetical protein
MLCSYFRRSFARFLPKASVLKLYLILLNCILSYCMHKSADAIC